MKKPDEVIDRDGDFSEYLWMAEDGAEEGLQQQVCFIMTSRQPTSCSPTNDEKLHGFSPWNSYGFHHYVYLGRRRDGAD